VRLFAGQKALRYLVPFGKVEDVIKYLRDAAATHPDGVAVFGDDMEKFGVWPGTSNIATSITGWKICSPRSKKIPIG